MIEFFIEAFKALLLAIVIVVTTGTIVNYAIEFHDWISGRDR